MKKYELIVRKDYLSGYLISAEYYSELDEANRRFDLMSYSNITYVMLRNNETREIVRFEEQDYKPH